MVQRQRTDDRGRASGADVNQKEFQFDPPVRIAGQKKAILDRLSESPASNIELAAICIRYSARIHELRKAGYDIQTYHQDKASGVCWYKLHE